MQTAVKDKIYTISEYLALEEKAKNKHEYYNGIIKKYPEELTITTELQPTCWWSFPFH
jgi:hypothetical protein